ncbi:MAG: hypothetical protein NC223_03160 [Butyrivibrio sp.]|nr:hypothetical protein [Butyrivibrio sp.]
MTEMDLLDGLAAETAEALKDFRLRSAKGNLIPINIYTQNLPLKEGKEDEKQYPYVCVCFDEAEIVSCESPKTVNVYFVIGIIDRAKDKQGFRDVLQIEELIAQHIFRKGIIAGAFRAEYPFRNFLQPEDVYPYFVGGIETRFEMPVVREEDEYI